MTRVRGAWLENPRTQAVMAMLESGGFQAYAVGGCVRNALLGEPVSDVDIATDARPATVTELATRAGLKPVPTGIEHGTITVVAAGEGFEVTTFRADVETDGRRAVVRFSNDIRDDALRRDFTLNALYADRRGRLFDPLGGLDDLQRRHLRFIENAETRIREDYLRILRFFRFFAWYGDPQRGMDAEALAAIAANLDGLDILSRERVGMEITKLLSAPDPLMAVSVMARTGVLSHVLPGAVVDGLGPVLAHETTLQLAPDPLRRLAALGFFDGPALRLSKPDQRLLQAFESRISDTQSVAEIAWREGSTMGLSIAALRAAAFAQPLQMDAQTQVVQGASAQFPVSAQDLMPAYQGAALGAALKTLEKRWIESGFTLDKSALLAGLQTGSRPGSHKG